MLAAASALAAQSPGPDHTPSTGGRALGSHTFVPILPVASPFVGTSFGARGGIWFNRCHGA